MNDLKEIVENKTKNKTKNKNKNKNKSKHKNKPCEELEEPEYTKCVNSLDSRQVQDTQLNKDKKYSALKESIKVNKWFYLSLILCFYMFKQSSPDNTSYIILVFSYIFIMVTGHGSHRISHHLNFTDAYNKYKKNNTNRWTCMDNIILKTCRVLDFHSTTHHDSAINKQPSNILYEFLNNMLAQGGFFILVVKFVNYFIDFRVILMWMLVYATNHNINYLFLKPSTHRDHHLDGNTNYGIDFADILFDTKYNLDDIEIHNHISINIILVTLLIIYFYKWYK
jgi:hypothetical protein